MGADLEHRADPVRRRADRARRRGDPRGRRAVAPAAERPAARRGRGRARRHPDRDALRPEPARPVTHEARGHEAGAPRAVGAGARRARVEGNLPPRPAGLRVPRCRICPGHWPCCASSRWSAHLPPRRVAVLTLNARSSRRQRRRRRARPAAAALEPAARGSRVAHSRRDADRRYYDHDSFDGTSFWSGSARTTTRRRSGRTCSQSAPDVSGAPRAFAPLGWRAPSIDGSVLDPMSPRDVGISAMPARPRRAAGRHSTAARRHALVHGRTAAYVVRSAGAAPFRQKSRTSAIPTPTSTMPRPRPGVRWCSLKPTQPN